MALVICCMFLTLRMRRLMSIKTRHRLGVGGLFFCLFRLGRTLRAASESLLEFLDRFFQLSFDFVIQLALFTDRLQNVVLVVIQIVFISASNRRMSSTLHRPEILGRRQK